LSVAERVRAGAISADIKTISGPSKKYGLKRDEYLRYCKHNGKVYYSDMMKKKTNRETMQKKKRTRDLGLA